MDRIPRYIRTYLYFYFKRKFTQLKIMTAARDGTMLGTNECDVHVHDELSGGFVEMQPLFKNISLTRDGLGSFIRRFAKITTSWRYHHACGKPDGKVPGH